MIYTLLFAGMMLAIFWSIGSSLTRFLRVHAGVWEFVLGQLAGSALVFGLGACFYAAGLPSNLFLVAILFLGILSKILETRPWERRRANNTAIPANLRLILKNRIKTVWLLAPPVVLMMLLQKKPLESSFAFRVGPDFFGWSDAALSICKGQTLSNLSSTVTRQLHGTPLMDSFVNNGAPGKTSIDQISSFTDQAASEFLIGAHRTGIPMFSGSICQSFGEALFPSLFVALLLWAMLMTTLIIFHSLRLLGSNSAWSQFFAVIGALNVGLISVICEGGYGQFITLPVFILSCVLLFIKQWNPKTFTYVFVLLLVTAASSYLDVLYMAIPVIGLTILLGAKQGRYVGLLGSFRNWRLLVCALLVSTPMLFNLPRLIIGMLGNPRAGGWDQGHIYSLANIFGVTQELPRGHYIISQLGPYAVTFELIMSAVLAILFFRLNIWKNPLLLTFIVGYAYLSYSVYVGVQAPNNYRLWKYSAYLGVFLPIALAALMGTNVSRSVSKRWSAKKVAVGIVLLISATSSITWIEDWSLSRNFTLTGEAARVAANLESKYDLAIADGLYGAMFSLYGDLHYVSSDRGGGPVFRSTNRKLVVLVRHGTEVSVASLNSMTGTWANFTAEELINRNDTFDAYLMQ